MNVTRLTAGGAAGVVARTTLAVAFGVLFLGCSGSGSVDLPSEFEGFEGVEVELPDGTLVPAELVYFDNDRDETLIGVLAVPDRPPPWPAVVVLHGAGGLFSTPDSNDTEYELPDSFAEWAKMLTDNGFAAIFPSSFVSRGFLEWHESSPERLVTRLYDAYAALAYACDRPDMFCDRVGAVGFSNGASTTVLMMHEGVRDIDGMGQLRPKGQFAFGSAFYPGCGFNGLVEMSSDDPTELYAPGTEVWIHHGEDDSLVDNCEDRVAQVDRLVDLGQYASNPLHLTVYPDAGHGFDSSPSGDDERAARDEARQRTLDVFVERL